MAGPSKWIAHRSDLCVMDPQQVVCPSHPFIQTCVEAVAAYKVHVVIEIDLWAALFDLCRSVTPSLGDQPVQPTGRLPLLRRSAVRRSATNVGHPPGLLR